MEQWETLVRGFPTSPDLRYFGKVVQTASVVLKEDLAPFEIDWVLETLLHNPVNLLSAISSNCTDDSWNKVIGDSFKLLTDIITEHGTLAEQHFEDIVTLCVRERAYDATTRVKALQCLESVARRSAAGARGVERHISALQEQNATCRAPLAELIGTICEYYPEKMEDHMTIVWRTFLNILDSKKNSDKVNNAVLRGVAGLFKYFGSSLPTAELNGFFDTLVDQCLNKARSQDACHKIISRYGSLFRERIASDVRVRDVLWSAVSEKNAPAALRSAYRAVGEVVDKNAAMNIITTELVHHAQAFPTREKYTALRVIADLQTKFSIHCTEHNVDLQFLEFELRNSNVSFDSAEAVSFCIETNQPNSDKLLQTAILFYDNLPSTKRKDIVVHGLLSAEPDVRNESIKFLITESCQDSSAIDKYSPLWKDLFDTNKGTDEVVAERSRLVFEEFMSNTVFVLESFLEENLEIIPDKLSNLLYLSSHVISQQDTDDYTLDYCSILVTLIVEIIKKYGNFSAAMSAARVACERLEESPVDLYKLILIDRCRDEALLCESCLTLLTAPEGFEDNVLMALQIIFSRNDVEPKMLSKSLHKMESLILSKKRLDENRVSDMIRLVLKLRERTDMAGKDAKVLHRDVLMFLGKYGSKADVDSNMDVENLIVKLKDTLSLSVPNPYDGFTYKINLQRVLHLAIIKEEPNASQVLLAILCANLATRKDQHFQQALTLVTHSLSRSHSRGATIDTASLQTAVLQCDAVPCVHQFLQYISSETSPGVRRMLSDALEGLLVKPGSEELVVAAAERSAAMLASELPTRKRAGLDIAQTIIVALKENNTLTTQFLPNMLVLISRTDELDSEITFESASRVFLEKIELFNNETITKLEIDLLRTLLERKSNMADVDVKIVRSANRMCLGFIKKIFDYKHEDISTILELFWQIFEKHNVENPFYVLAELRQVFVLNSDLYGNVLCHNDSCLLNMLLCMEVTYDDDVCMEGVLKFMEKYAEGLLELHYENSLKFLAQIIKNIPPISVKNQHKNLKSCLSVYEKILKKTPACFKLSFESWCQQLPLKLITDSVDKELFSSDHALTVNALKIMLNIFNLTDLSILTDLKEHAEKWPRVLLKLYSSGFIERHLKSKMAYLTDLLSVSVRFIDVAGVKRLISEGVHLEGVSNEKIGIKFCRFFMNVFYERFLVRPYFLLDDDMEACCAVLDDVVKYVVKKKCTDDQYNNILELVNEIWPKYEKQATFNQKHILLLNMNSLPKKLQSESNPMQWAIKVISEGTNEEKARIIGVLPGGEGYSGTYRTFASALPTRLSEQSSVSLRSLLDALAATGDRLLFDILVTLCSGEEKKGWWDDVIESCMASLAQRYNELCTVAYTRCFESLSLAVCDRVTVPLLRYSTTSFCERFFSTIIKRELERLNKVQKTPSMHYSYRQHLVHYVNSFRLLTTAFEKIPPSSIESPTSVLYRELNTEKSWHLPRELGKCCLSLRNGVVLPESADAEVRNIYRLFQCANYNCLCAALCCCKPQAKIYKCLFDADVWNKIVDCDAVYRLKLRSQWNQKTKSRPVSIDVSSEEEKLSPSTLRTRSLFLHTLSEDALKYDLIDCRVTEEVNTQELQLQENELNSHECSLTLTALLRHCSGLPHTDWRETLGAALRSESHKNVKFILAQAICNSKEQLKPHASELTPALLALITDTACEENNRKLLNSLHVDVLETVISWNSFTPSQHLNTAVEYLITTCLMNRERVNIFSSLLDTLGKILNLCCDVEIGWSVFEPYIEERTDEAKRTIQILKKICRFKINIPEIIDAVLNKIERKQFQIITLAELFGLAVTACRDERVRQEMLLKYRAILERMWRGRDYAEYVKMLAYAQAEYSGCCDENHFRKIVDLVPKLPGRETSKCLQIIASYISVNQSSFISEMFEIIELCELLLTEDNIVDALGVGREGLPHMESSLKRRVVMQTADYCAHSLVKVRKAALLLVLKAFEELSVTETGQQAKRPRTAISTPILRAMETKDAFTMKILTSLAHGCVDSDVGAFVREELSKLLHKDMAVRFTECFIMTICLTHKSNNKSVCVSALLEMLLSDLRSQERFLRAKLREEPWGTRESTMGPSKLLTLSRTYQGTFRGYSSLSGRTRQAAKSKGIDVQISIDSILSTFLQFAKTTPETAEALCVQFLKCIRSDPLLALSGTMSEQIYIALDKATNDLTPFVINVAREFVDDCCKIQGFEETVQKLKDKTKSTEGEEVVKLLYEEVMIRRRGRELFVLGCMEGNRDVKMEEALEFSIEGLTAAFGSLSNWDELTMQEKRNMRSGGLPPLWTDDLTFQNCLEGYRVREGWFGKLICAYRHEDKQNTMQWLREFDAWPRRHFAISAVAEAIEWQSREGDQYKLPSEIQPSDCMCEWSARFMIRKMYLQALVTDNQQSVDILSRSNELKWCERANEMGLSSLVTACIKRNKEDLYRSEALPWLRQKVLVLRMMGLERNDSELLTEALDTAETYTPHFIENSSPEVINEMNKLMLLLNQDLKSLSTEKIEDVLKGIDKQNGVTVTQSNRKTLHSIYEIAMTHYDDLFDESTESQRNSLLSNMSDILGRAIEVEPSKCQPLAAMLINRLDCVDAVDEYVAADLLGKIQILAPTLDECFLHALRSNSNLFPSRLLSDYAFMSERDDNIMYKQWFQLVCDPEYTLKHYCEMLRRALLDGDAKEWNEVFARMREKMFDNKYAGTDYQLLTKYKNSLCEIQDFESTESYKNKTKEILNEIIRELEPKRARSILLLSQLCPALSRAQHTALNGILALPEGVTVVKFDQQVEVFIDSVRRPVKLSARLSNGLTRRWLHKCGEPLRRDHGAVAALRHAPAPAPAAAAATLYQVTMTSEDSALIEFLDDHERLRSLIFNSCPNVDVVFKEAEKTADHELILKPAQAAKQHYYRFSDKVPRYALRSAIERNSASIEDFINRKKKFQETISSMTIINWILGLGDRHLQNIMYSTVEGGVCCIDWGALFQYGRGEIPPARLTANVLAVCDTKVLESKLQNILSSLRVSNKTFLAVVKIAFKWMGPELDDKYAYMKTILEGKSLSYQITRDVIGKSNVMYKDKYIQLLDNIFGDFIGKESYSVEEQISCLLRQCTDPHILGVTRSGWEPWV